MSIQETIANALALWSEKRAESTVRCQGIYFSLLLKTAGENGFDAPCQKLYDLFLEGATTPATRSSRTRIVKAAVTSEGSFFNEPPFPTRTEARVLLSSLQYPISKAIDISIMISYAANIIENLETSCGGKRQYWHAWRDIRIYIFRYTSSLNYNARVLDAYIAELNVKYENGAIPQTNYYMHRKAALILKEIAETGHFQCVSASDKM